MTLKKIIGVTLVAALTGGLFCFTACENGNIFGGLHDRGDSGDPDALLSDGDVALREGDFAEALSLYNRVLDKDPNNAKALYGSAAALLGTSGLNLGQIITNVLKQGVGSSSVNGLPDLIQQARTRSSISSAADADSILSGIDLEDLNDSIDQVICRLSRIVCGNTDGSISKDSTDVLVNLGILYVVRAALRPIRSGFIDIINVNGSYEIVDKTTNWGNTFCGAIDMASDISASYKLFDRAVVVLNLDSNQIISKIRGDIDSIIGLIINSGDGMDLDASCITVLSGMPITSESSFKNYSNVLTTPPSGC